jgi:AMP-binding enzyme
MVSQKAEVREAGIGSDAASGGILLGYVLDIARVDATSLALRHKYRGVWKNWSWREVAADIDRWASALAAHGVGSGTAIAIVGEIDPTLIFSSIAALSLGAEVVTAPEDIAAAEIGTLVAARQVRVAVIQSRYSVATWQDALQPRGGSVRIVFDHATPNGVSPDRAVATVADFLESAAPSSVSTLGASPGTQSVRLTLWAEASTAWPDALITISEAWLAAGHVLALPERLASAGNDRAEIGPDRWIASFTRFAASAAEISDRLPRAGSWTHRLAAPALRPTSRPGSLMRRLLRRRLGLSRLTEIEVGGQRQAAPHDLTAERLFASLGVTVSGSIDQSVPRAAASAPEANHRLIFAGSRR